MSVGLSSMRIYVLPTDLPSVFGCVYDANGAHLDLEKVSAVPKVLAPETATQLQMFLRLVTYLSSFIPSLSSTHIPMWAAEERNRILLEQLLSWSIQQSQIRDLQGYHTVVLWHLQAMSLSKSMHPKKAQVLPSFRMDAQLPLLPKLLHLCEQYYANIECKPLTYVFGAEWFHTYVFGCAFTVESDYKPLEQINIKNLGDTPVLSTENAALTPKLWYNHQVSTWQRDAGCRCPLSLCTPARLQRYL